MFIDFTAATFFIVATILSLYLLRPIAEILALFGCAVGFLAMLRIDGIERKERK